MASSSNTDTDKSIQWIENGIKNRYLIYYERSEFQNQEFISEGTFYVLYKTNWGSFNTVVTLKSFKGTFIKEIVNEVNKKKKSIICYLSKKNKNKGNTFFLDTIVKRNSFTCKYY